MMDPETKDIVRRQINLNRQMLDLIGDCKKDIQELQEIVKELREFVEMQMRINANKK